MKKKRELPEGGRLLIRKSICSGERTLLLEETKTGKTQQLGCIQTDEELRRVAKAYGVRAEDVPTVY